MKYQQGKHIMADGHVYLKILLAVEGDYNCYGTVNVKNPRVVKWYTEQELTRTGFSHKEPDFNSFDHVKVGDTIKTGDTYRQVLARMGEAMLLSMSKDKQAKMLLTAIEEVEKVAGEELMDNQEKQTLKDHASPIKTRNMAEDWWDVRTMVLMNWYPVTEVIEEAEPKALLEQQLDELRGQ